MYKHIASHFIPGIAEVLVVERVTHGRFSLRGLLGGAVGLLGLGK